MKHQLHSLVQRISFTTAFRSDWNFVDLKNVLNFPKMIPVLCVFCILLPQIREQMCHISNMKIQSWTVLGSRGYREKKIPNCHKYATFQGSFFYVFRGKKNLSKKCCSVRNKKLHTIKLRKI